MSYDEIRNLGQFLDSLEEASQRLEDAYVNKNIDEINRIKQFILEVQSRIDALIK